MSRKKTVVKVSNVPLIDVRRTIFKWLEKNGFAILSLNSDGSPILFGYYMARVMLHPKAGTIVCLHYKASGAIAFEVDIRPGRDEVHVDLEGYAAGASLWAGHEWDLGPDVILMGRWPRKKGYRLMLELEKELHSLSK
jgi:hypothetical protein